MRDLYRYLFLFISLFFLFILPEKAFPVTGIPDVTKAATLVVPLLEAGVSSSHNTFVVVENLCDTAQIIHWETWTPTGGALGIKGNVSINASGSWTADFRNMLESALGMKLIHGNDGPFFRGFMTMDIVEFETPLSPFQDNYPFKSLNCLTGHIYYVRLPEGAANGIPALHIEGGVSLEASPDIRGFYKYSDDREEIDNYSIYHANLVSRNLPPAPDPDGLMDLVVSRVFLSPLYDGKSRIVIWAWSPSAHGAAVSPKDVGGPFPFQHFDEAGNLVREGFVQLDKVVNVIDVEGGENGYVWIRDIPGHFYVYAFSFNSASGGKDLWETAFVSTVIAE
jgi:hypothetical protein